MICSQSKRAASQRKPPRRLYCALVDEDGGLNAEGAPPRGQFGTVDRKVRGHLLLKPSFDYPRYELRG